MSSNVTKDNEVTIAILQGRLNDRGANLVVDSWGGDETRKALDKYLPPINPAAPPVSDEQRFQALLDAEGIRYFSASEVFYLGGSNARLKLNTPPPERLWKNIIPTLRVLDEVREAIGGLLLNSIYRNEAYNRAVGGATGSYHMQFRACDVMPVRATVAELHAAVLRLRNLGRFKGGVGRYPSFVHVDTRGHNADF